MKSLAAMQDNRLLVVAELMNAKGCTSYSRSHEKVRTKGDWLIKASIVAVLVPERDESNQALSAK